MTDTLYLRLESPDATATIDGHCVAADGAMRGAALRGSLPDLLAAHRDARVVALIPAAEALATTARLPKISSAKLRHSLPFALEEQLATDLEGQHFALGSPREAPAADGTPGLEVPVLVIARTRLAAWLELLRGAGAEPTALHLAEDCIAAKPGDVVAWVRNERELFLRAPSGQGLSSGLDELAVSLGLLLGETPRQTLGLQPHASAELLAASRAPISAKLEVGGATLARVASTAAYVDTLGWLVGQLELARPINLLQGDFAPRRTVSAAAGRWRLVAALAAVLVMLVMVDRARALRTSLASERQLDDSLLQAAQVSAPNVRSVDDLVRAVGAASRDPQGAPLLRAALRDLVAAGLASDSLKSVSMQGKALRIELRPGIAALDIVAPMKARGWQVDAVAGEAGGQILSLARADTVTRP